MFVPKLPKLKSNFAITMALVGPGLTTGQRIIIKTCSFPSIILVSTHAHK